MTRIFPVLHFVLSLFLAFALVYVQAYVLSFAGPSWLHVDLLAIFVFYVGLEHHTFAALLKIILASVVLELISSVPAGFYVMAHILMMLIGNRVALWLEMEHRFSQLILFFFLMFLKETLFIGTVVSLEDSVLLGDLVAQRLPGALLTVGLALPLMEFLAVLDSRFEESHGGGGWILGAEPGRRGVRRTRWI